MNVINGFLVYRIIEEHIKNKAPLSLIRLGDGEGAVLGFPNFTSLTNVERIGRIWFGDSRLKKEDFISLSEQIKTAVKSADIIGVPRQRQVEKDPLYGAVHQSLTKFELISETAVLTDAAVHRYLQFALLYRPLLQNRSFVGMISSRDLRAQLTQIFNIESIKLYQIRGEHRFPGTIEIDHYPDQFEWLKNNVSVPYPGAIFLVGAGALGKIYCDIIKQRGGIAIDVGAIFDAWAGVKSRLKHPCHSLQRYEEIPQITVERAILRYNGLIRAFKLDTPLAERQDMAGNMDVW